MNEKVRILWVDPVGQGEFYSQVKKILTAVKRDDVEIDVTRLTQGPPHLEYRSYESLILVETLEKIVGAERQGYDAVVIGCFGDPGLQEARELVKIPVIGPAETCMHLACMLGHKFSIISPLRANLGRVEERVVKYGLEKKLASIRFLDMRVQEMKEEPEKLHNTIMREAKRAVEEDNAEVIILGCTVETGFMKQLIDELKVPVVDVTVVSFKFAEALADLKKRTGLSHSKIYGYKSPRENEMLIGT